MLYKTCLLVSLLTLNFGLVAQEDTAWGGDISLTAQHQEFEFVSADMNGIEFSPWFKAGDWTVTMSLPWVRMEGDYFSNGDIPRVVNFCQRVEDTPPLILQRLVARGRLSQTQIDRCGLVNQSLADKEAAQSGFSDLSLTLDYLHYWGLDEQWWTSVSIDYKHDNANWENSLGNGSRDTTLGLGLGYEGQRWFSHITYSFTRVSPSDTPYDVDDYASIGLGLGINLDENLRLGLDRQYEQAYLRSSESIENWNAYVQWSLSESWTLVGSVSDYSGSPEAPQSEYALNLVFSF